MAVKLDVIGSSPAWPNPGGACSGYLVDDRLLLDCGAGVLAKLREREPWPNIDAIAITHLHLDHWGDLIPWVWGSLFGPGNGMRPALWLPPGSREELKPILARLGNEEMLERAFEVAEYEAGTPFDTAGLSVCARKVVHYDIDAHGFRVEGERTLALLRRHGALRRARRARPRRRPVRLRGDARARRGRGGAPRPPVGGRGGRDGRALRSEAAPADAPAAGTEPPERPRARLRRPDDDDLIAGTVRPLDSQAAGCTAQLQEIFARKDPRQRIRSRIRRIRPACAKRQAVLARCPTPRARRRTSRPSSRSRARRRG